MANGASGDDWQGCELHIEEVRIAGGVTSPLDVAPFQIVKDDIGWHFRAEVRETTVAVGSHAAVQVAARDGHNNATLIRSPLPRLRTTSRDHRRDRSSDSLGTLSINHGSGQLAHCSL